MNSVMIEGYIQRFERACLQERPRAERVIRRPAREASHADQDRAAAANRLGVGRGGRSTARRGNGHRKSRFRPGRLAAVSLLVLAMLLGTYAVIHAQPFVDPPVDTVPVTATAGPTTDVAPWS